MWVTFRVGNPYRTFISIASCNNMMPMPKKMETDTSPRSGKGLCAPVIDKSLLSKSKTGSIAVFRAVRHVSTCVAVYTGATPKSAFAAAKGVFGVSKSTSTSAKAAVRFLSTYPLSATIHRPLLQAVGLF